MDAGLNVDGRWELLKGAVLEVAERTLGRVKPENRKEWVTEEVMQMIEERRKLKNSRLEEDQKNYRTLRNAINRKAREAKERNIVRMCEEVEACMNGGSYEAGYRLIKTYFGDQRRMWNGAIKDESDNFLFDEGQITARWKRYIEELYEDEEADSVGETLGATQQEREEEHRGVLRREYEAAIKKIKDKKAPGIDEVAIELIKQGGDKLNEELYEQIKNMYERGELPEDFKKNLMISIPKKSKAKDCKDYRTLSLTAHVSKIVTAIVLKRIDRKIEEVLTEDQFGFRKGRGTREAIMALRLILEKRMEVNKSTCVAFVDLEKAFDNVRWRKLFEVLKKIGISYQDRKIIWQLYEKERAIIRYGKSEDTASIRKGVRQGCNLSPALFNAYIQDGLDSINEESDIGIRVQGERINMLRFADDIAVLTENEQEMNDFLNRMDERLGVEYNLRVNIEKTAVMMCERRRETRLNVVLRGKRLRQVEEFTYLGSKITEDGRCERDIKSRIAQAKLAFGKARQVLTSKSITQETRKRFLRNYVWSVALYGCETWNVGAEERRRLDSFEMWCYRRMLKIGWTDRVRNEEVLARMGCGMCLWRSIVRRRTELIGHTLRHESLLKTVLEGRVEGRRGRGRPRRRYMDQIMRDVNCHSYTELKRMAQERQRWRIAANQSQD
jgi:Reverse transcriptase (RNA-dependent DNA polymerase).